MSTTSPALNNASPFASWKVGHAGIDVPDFEAAIAWYTEKLNFRLKHSWPMGEKTFGMISPAGDDRFSLEVIGGPGLESRLPYTDLPSSHNMVGWHHVCFHVASVDDAVAALKQQGVTIVSEPRDAPAIASRFAFFADPWGNLFEIMQPLSK